MKKIKPPMTGNTAKLVRLVANANCANGAPASCAPNSVASASVPHGMMFMPSSDSSNALRSGKSCTNTGTVKNSDTPKPVSDSSAGAAPSTMTDAIFMRDSAMRSMRAPMASMTPAACSCALNICPGAMTNATDKVRMRTTGRSAASRSAGRMANRESSSATAATAAMPAAALVTAPRFKSSAASKTNNGTAGRKACMAAAGKGV